MCVVLQTSLTSVKHPVQEKTNLEMSHFASVNDEYNSFGRQLTSARNKHDILTSDILTSRG